MNEFCFATNLEAIAAAMPSRTFLTFRERSFTYADFRARSRRLARYLLACGLGRVVARAQLRDHESGQDHVGLYLHNGNEYLEGMMGAFMARAVPFNVNYRYVQGELEYLFRDARPRALIYHARFAPLLAEIAARLPRPLLLLQVADESGEALLEGAVDYEAALASVSDEALPVEPAGEDLYMLYTGGTTGLPKGVLWRQHDVFMGAMGGTYGEGKQHGSLTSVVERALALGAGLRVCPIPPFMHGAAHWVAFATLVNGGSLHLPPTPQRLVPHEVWELIERTRATSMVIVGDAFAIPLLEELERKRYELSSLRMITSGGAILSAHVKARLREQLSGLTIRDTLGSSESGTQAVVVEAREPACEPDTEGGAEFQLHADSAVASQDLSRLLDDGESETGYLVRSGYIPLGYLGDPEKTRRTFVTIAGRRYAVPGDHARLLGKGRVKLLGRGSVCINTGGEKVYPEEVEEVLKTHPAVYDAVVVGVPHEKWGAMVAAIVETRVGQTLSLEDVVAHGAARLSRYKLPKKLVLVERMVRSPSGKADYRWARELAGRDDAGSH